MIVGHEYPICNLCFGEDILFDTGTSHWECKDCYSDEAFQAEHNTCENCLGFGIEPSDDDTLESCTKCMTPEPKPVSAFDSFLSHVVTTVVNS